jgi:hypothetical protein
VPAFVQSQILPSKELATALAFLVVKIARLQTDCASAFDRKFCSVTGGKMHFYDMMDKHPSKDVLNILLKLKSMGVDHFSHATLLRDVEMHVWDGKHPVGEHMKTHVAKTGTRVLITVFSGLGHLCIRDFKIDDLTHGYYSAVEINDVTDVVLKSPPPPSADD